MSQVHATAPNLLIVGASPTGGATSMQQGILAGGQVASASTDTTVYTTAAKTSTTVSSCVLTNTDAFNPITVSLSVVPSGGSVDGTHKVLASWQIKAGDTLSLPELAGSMIGPGDFVSINASTAAKLNYLLTGTEAVAP